MYRDGRRGKKLAFTQNVNGKHILPLTVEGAKAFFSECGGKSKNALTFLGHFYFRLAKELHNAK